MCARVLAGLVHKSIMREVLHLLQTSPAVTVVTLVALLLGLIIGGTLGYMSCGGTAISRPALV